MESKTQTKKAEIVQQLQVDRKKLLNRQLLPAWFHVASGILAAMYVITPILPTTDRSTGYIFLLVAMLLFVYMAQRETGVKVSGGGAAGFLVLLSIFAAVTAGHIVTLALVSLQLSWWSILPAAAVMSIVITLSKTYEKLLKNRIANGR